MAVRVADKIKQHGDADFFLIDAEDVEMNDGSSLEETLNNLSTSGGTTEGHTHDNKDMLDKIIYIDAYSGSSVDCSVFDNTTNDIYCINLKDKSVWNKLVDNAKTDSDFRLTTSSGLIIGSSSLELGTGVSEYYIFMLSSINTLVTNTHETTYSGTQYFITPEGNIYTRYIKKKIVSDSDTGTDTTTITYSDFTILEKEIISSKVTELTETSTDTQYPSAKAVYDALVTKADKTDVGDITDLSTEETGSIVGAVNELNEGKVGFTDYPFWDTNAQAIPGVVRTVVANVSVDGIKIDEEGYIRLSSAPEGFISSRTGDAPITPSNLDYAVRSVKPKVVIEPDGGSEANQLIPSRNSILDINGVGVGGNSIYLMLPGGSSGDFIQVDFVSGDTPPTLVIASPGYGMSDVDLIPEANTAYSLYFDWGSIGAVTTVASYGWRFSYAAYPYNTEV